LDPFLRELVDDKEGGFCILRLMKAIGQPELGFYYGMKLAQEE